MQKEVANEKWQHDLKDFFPQRLLDALMHMEPSVAAVIEEIRIRANKPLAIGYSGRIAFLKESGFVTSRGTDGMPVSLPECAEVLSRATKYSVYALEEEMKRGFITLTGGYRIGISGHAVVEQGQIKLIAPCSALNFRIARQIIGAADQVLPYINNDGIQSALILSPPRRGKTTVLRDIARQLSDCGYNVAVADERNEISGCVHGVPHYDLGDNTDVLNSGPKAEAMMMLLRGMSPHVIITDEIGSSEDAAAIQEALNAGVAVIASAHALDKEQAAKRPHLKKMMESGAFKRYVVLSACGRIGSIDTIFDANGLALYKKKEQRRNAECFALYAP
ncbi:MAG: stage III sporulation protein AA [Christensenellales bacterium]